MTDLTIKQAISVAPSMYEARIPWHFKSAPGMGKSDMVRLFAEVLSERYGEKFGLVTAHLSQYDAPDIRGYLIPAKTDDGPVSYYTMPQLIKAIGDTGLKRGILFFDERAQADHLVQKAVAPIILDRMVGDYALPDGWWIVSASNRTSDRSGANRELAHLINRECQCGLKFNIDEYQSWAAANGVHPMMIAFNQARPDLFVTEVPNDQKPFMTPRSAARLGQWLMRQLGPETWQVPTSAQNPAIYAISEGFIGQGPATELAGFSSMAQFLPTIKEIIADPMKAKMPPKEEIGGHYACLQYAVHHADAKNIGPVFKYIRRLRKELQVSAAKALIQKTGGVLFNDPVMAEFLQENRALIIGTYGGQ